jgi:hypothetical protein
VGIDWPVPLDDLIPSPRDKDAPMLHVVESVLPFTYAG